MDKMPTDDDRDWVDNDLHNGRDNGTIRDLPILSLIGNLSYHLFGTAQSSDIKYNGEMIETLNGIVGEMNEDITDMDK